MSEITYKGVKFTLSPNTQAPSFLVLGVRKSGSSILNSMVQALTERQGLPFVDVAGQLFKAGVKVGDWLNDPDMASLLSGGNVYGGFRNCPTGLLKNPKMSTYKKILLVRDPRDALVSEYFSNAFSHTVPKDGGARDQMLALRKEALNASVEAFAVQRAPQMAKTLMEYAPLLNDPLNKIFKYEAVITEKRKLLEDISRHFGWSYDDKHITAVLNWADQMPDEERPTQFVRRVLPGDHKEKLSPAVITQVNEILEEPMRLFGYSA